jgi:hypothetical protein
VTDDHSSHVPAGLVDLRDVVTWLRDEAQSLTGDRDHLQSSIYFGRYSPCGETHLARRAALSILDDHRARWEEHREELVSLATALDKALDHYADLDTDTDTDTGTGTEPRKLER